MMEAGSTSEMLVNLYATARRKTPEASLIHVVFYSTVLSVG
jgi:hypothetical protein